MPVVTVLIPTHDHAETLPIAIASVREQTLQDFELLVVGDGVGEATRKIASELSADFRRLPQSFVFPSCGKNRMPFPFRP